MRLLFESDNYSRAAFVSLSWSLRWRAKVRSSIEWLLDRQENLLVVADWFTSLFEFASLVHDEFHVCTCYSSIRHAHCSYYSRTALISFSTRGGVTTVREQLLIESGVWLSGYSTCSQDTVDIEHMLKVLLENQLPCATGMAQTKVY